jgi:hypothetical protein
VEDAHPFACTPDLRLVEVHQLLFAAQQEIDVGIAPRLALIRETLKPRFVLAQRLEGSIHPRALVLGKTIAGRRQILGELSQSQGPRKNTCRRHVCRHRLNGSYVCCTQARLSASCHLACALRPQNLPGPLDGLGSSVIHRPKEFAQLAHRGLARFQHTALVGEKRVHLGGAQAVGAGVGGGT